MLDRTRRISLAAALLMVAAGIGSPRAESAFDADPGHKALLVVDAVVRHKSLLASSESPIVAGAIRNRAMDGKAGAHPHSVQAIAGALPFAVDPGRYRPASVRARARRMQVGTGTVDLQIPLPTDSLAGLDRTVAAGAVVYLGRIDILAIPRPLKENEYRFTLAYDPGREREVWEALLAQAKTGPWEEAIRGRLAGLSALSDTAAAPVSSPPDSTR